jgi:hypothetical protein
MAFDITKDSRTFNVHPNNTSTATVTKIRHNIVRMAYRLIKTFSVTRFNTETAMLMETPMDTRVSYDSVRCRSHNSRSPTTPPFLIPGWDSEGYLFVHDIK